MTIISPAAVRLLIADFFSSIGECEVATLSEVKVKVMLVDDGYSTITRSEILALARVNSLGPPAGASESQCADCDDYALHLKDAAAAKRRQRSANDSAPALPPAVAIVMSQNHALNMFIDEGAQGRHSLWFIDTSEPDLPTTNDPAQALRMMKQPPVRLIYM